MTARIVILTGNSLCHNPRTIKEATTLARNGYDVVVLGGWYDPVFKQRDRTLLEILPFKFVAVIDSTESEARRLSLRVRSKLGALAQRFARVENRWQLGFAYSALRRAALRQRANL